MKSNVLLVPHWAVKTIRRNGLSIESLLDFQQMKKCFSPDELIGMAVLANRDFSKRVFGGHQDGYTDSIVSSWHFGTKTESDRALLRSYETMAGDSHYREAVEQQLFSEDSLNGRYPNAYEIVPVGTKALAVILYPGHFAHSRAGSHHLDVARDVLKQLYVYEQHTVVSAMPLTKRYLELLSQ